MKTENPISSNSSKSTNLMKQNGVFCQQLAKEFEPSAQTIRNWVYQAERDAGQRSDGLPSPEQEELRQLRRENKQLRLEREILAKATAWFARETDAIAKDSSRS
jgi:transposase